MGGRKGRALAGNGGRRGRAPQAGGGLVVPLYAATLGSRGMVRERGGSRGRASDDQWPAGPLGPHLPVRLPPIPADDAPRCPRPHPPARPPLPAPNQTHQ